MLLVALQIMNVGLFAQDFEVIPQQGEDNNIINSVTEYIAEVVLKKYDNFPEDNKAPQQQKHHHFGLKNQLVKLAKKDNLTIKIPSRCLPINKYHFDQDPYLAFAKEINVPPPKA